jgi:hypothetical protein
MMGGHFYNKHVRTCVSIFGSLFHDINIVRERADGTTLNQIKVPLSYAPKRNFLERLEEMAQGEEAERRVAIKLPRMSFEIISVAYDPQRQLPKVNQFKIGEERNSYIGTPYILTFQLSVYAKTQDDALQIVEQIIPYFAPQYTLSVRPFSDHPEFVEDVPISLNGLDFQDDYEGPLENRRTIIYTLNFDMKMMFYGPDRTNSLIRDVNINMFLDRLNQDEFIHNINITPSPIDVSPDSDYGFNLEYDDERFE